jgi:hypothetical protein
MSAWVRRLAVAGLAIGVLMILAVVVMIAIAVSHGRPMPISYWVIDDRTLGVQVMDGPDSRCRIAATDETATEVRVRVECQEPFPGTGSTAAGYLYEFVAHLQAPLAGRRVLDGSGAPAEPCATPGC